MSTPAVQQYSPAASPQTQSGDLARAVAILGAGRVGTALARVLMAAGYQVRIAGSGPAAGIELVASVLAPGAQATDAVEAVHGADVVILAVPLHRIDSVDPALLRGKVVVDVMNYWEPIDGTLPDFANADGTSAVVARRFSASHVVKAFNHIGYYDMESDARETGHPERRALAVAGDSRPAVDLVLDMVHRIGFDAVDAGGLADARILEAGGPVFGVRLGKSELARRLTQEENTLR